MYAQRWKIIVAVVLALIGCLAIGRLFYRQSHLGTQNASAAVEPEPAHVLAVIRGSFDTVPTPESVLNDIERASRRLEILLDENRLQIVQTNRRADLVLAFEERLRAVVSPDHARDKVARQSRGQSVSIGTDSGNAEALSSQQNSIFALMPMDIQSMDVLTVYQQGVLRMQPAYLDGFRENTTRIKGPNAFPLMESDPERQEFDVVEVRLPMNVPIPPPKDGATERRLVGFQFVWSRERNQWIPWAIKQYGGPNSGGSYTFPF